MSRTDRRALVVTTATAADPRSNGAVLRAEEVVALLQGTGYAVRRSPPSDLGTDRGPYQLGVAVSYACAPALRHLRRIAGRTWLDAVDSWLLVNASGVRHGRPLYAARAARDATRLLRMPAPDLVTWISAADRDTDGRTVRGTRRLVLPGSLSRDAPTSLPAAPHPRIVLAGDWDYPPNAAGLRWFTSRVLPRLAWALPDAGSHVHVFGTGDTSVARAGGCRVVGYVENASELYRVGDVHVAPVHFGAGVKRKVLQPLLAGLAVVTTTAGAHGLRAHPMLDVHDDPSAFAGAVIRRLGEACRPTTCDPPYDADDTDAVIAWLRA